MNFNFYIIYNGFCSKKTAKERRTKTPGAGAAATLLLKIWSGSAALILSMERERRSIRKERCPPLNTYNTIFVVTIRYGII